MVTMRVLDKALAVLLNEFSDDDRNIDDLVNDLRQYGIDVDRQQCAEMLRELHSLGFIETLSVEYLTGRGFGVAKVQDNFPDADISNYWFRMTLAGRNELDKEDYLGYWNTAPST
jgi:hypothetical protein